MSENKELNEDVLDEVTGGTNFMREATYEESVIKDAKKKIATAAKAGKAINDAGEKKMAATIKLP